MPPVRAPVANAAIWRTIATTNNRSRQTVSASRTKITDITSAGGNVTSTSPVA